MKVSLALSLLAAWLPICHSLSSTDSPRDGDVPQSGYTSNHNFDPTTLAQYKVNWTATFQTAEVFYAKPLVYTPAGAPSERVYVVSNQNVVRVLDGMTGSVLVSRLLDPPFQSSDSSCGDIPNTIGIIGTPIIDTETDIMYLWSKGYINGGTGPQGVANGNWKLYALRTSDLTNAPGFPISIQGLNAYNDRSRYLISGTMNQRPGLTMVGNTIVTGFGSHCNNFNVTGYLVTASKTPGAGITDIRAMVSAPGAPVPQALELTSQKNGKSSIWQAGFGLALDATNNRLFFATGNGQAPGELGGDNGSPRSGKTYLSTLENTVACYAVEPSTGALTQLDWFTPTNYDRLNGADRDVGASGVALLSPDPFSGGGVNRIAVAAGKNGTVFIMDADNLGGFKTGPGQTDGILQVIAPNGASFFSGVASYPLEGGYIYFVPTDDSIYAYKFGMLDGKPHFTYAGKTAMVFAGRGAPRVTSLDGQVGTGIVWLSDINQGVVAYNAIPDAAGVLQPYSFPRTGRLTKFHRPSFGNARVYTTENNKILAMGGPAPPPKPSTTSTAVSSSSTAISSLSSSLVISLTSTSSSYLSLSSTSTISSSLSSSSPDSSLSSSSTSTSSESSSVSSLSPSSSSTVTPSLTSSTSTSSVSSSLSSSSLYSSSTSTSSLSSSTSTSSISSTLSSSSTSTSSSSSSSSSNLPSTTSTQSASTSSSSSISTTKTTSTSGPPTISASTTLTSFTTSTSRISASQTKSYSYVGCYSDTSKGHALPLLFSNKSVTPELCEAYVLSLASKPTPTVLDYFYLEYHQECYGGSSFAWQGSAVTSLTGANACTDVCSGSVGATSTGTAMCGGAKQFNLYLRSGGAGLPTYWPGITVTSSSSSIFSSTVSSSTSRPDTTTSQSSSSSSTTLASSTASQSSSSTSTSVTSSTTSNSSSSSSSTVASSTTTQSSSTSLPSSTTSRASSSSPITSSSTSIASSSSTISSSTLVTSSRTTSTSSAYVTPLPPSGQRKSINWNIEWVNASPDGHVRPMIGVNGQWPCPPIVLNYGDTLVLNVYNGLGNESTSIHFHGLHQRNTTFEDGPTFVTQCPIQPGDSFVYQFQAAQVGTYWYHSHHGGQYIDGLRGPFIVQNPSPPYGKVDQDITITLGDHYHEEAPYLINYYQSADNTNEHGGTEPVPQAALMNEARDIKLTMAPGKTNLFRIINIGALAGQYIQFDQHTMTVVEVDGMYVQPYEVQQLFVAVAQRYSVIVKSKTDNSQNYAIVASMNTDMFGDGDTPENPTVYGWLVYDGAKALPTPFTFQPQPFDDAVLVPLDQQPLMDPASQTIYFAADFGPDLNGITRSYLNGVTYVEQKVPTLYSALTAPVDYLNNAAIYGTGSNPYVIPYGAIIELEITNHDSRAHPFHLHGHVFQLIYRSEGGYLWPGLYDTPAMPMKRDVVVVYAQGTAVIRFVADNPGIQLFHCHTEWHVVGGMTATFIEAPTELVAQKPYIPASHRSVCDNHGISRKGNAAGNNKNWLDLTGANTEAPTNNWGALTNPPS